MRISFAEAINRALDDAMAADERLFLMGEDIGLYGGAFGVTKGLHTKYGESRVVDTPISEAGFTGVAVGAALAGQRPVIEIMFMDFITLAVDQLVNQAAKLSWVYAQGCCPLVVRAVNGAGKGYGPTHSQSFESWFMHVPGIKVVAPATVADAYALMRSSIADNNPVLFLEHKLLYNERVELETELDKLSAVPLGKAQHLSTGDDVTVISYGRMSLEAQAAAEYLRSRDIGVDHLDLRSLVPLDEEAIMESAMHTGRVLIVTEENNDAGVGAEIAARIAEQAFDYLEAPVRRLNMGQTPTGAAQILEDAQIPDRGSIAKAIVELCRG